MALNTTASEIISTSAALAEELGCRFSHGTGDKTFSLSFGEAIGSNSDFILNLQIEFKEDDSVSPYRVWLKVFTFGTEVKEGMDVTPESFTTMGDVESILRHAMSFKGKEITKRVKKLPTNSFTTTYDELNDFLSENSFTNDMHADSSGMIVVVYSSKTDDTNGIEINLHFVEDEDDRISLKRAEREANDHEWEDYSLKRITVKEVRSLPDLLDLVRKNIQPKKKSKTTVRPQPVQPATGILDLFGKLNGASTDEEFRKAVQEYEESQRLHREGTRGQQ